MWLKNIITTLYEENVMETKELKKIDAYFRAANYLSACQLYLIK